MRSREDMMLRAGEEKDFRAETQDLRRPGPKLGALVHVLTEPLVIDGDGEVELLHEEGEARVERAE